MIKLLQEPGSPGALQAQAATFYLSGDDQRARRLAQWLTAASDYAGNAAELLHKAAFRCRAQGALDAERRRLDAKADAKDVFSNRRETDDRMRDLRATLGRLAACDTAIAEPVPDDAAGVDRMLNLLCGPGGWRHNMPLLDGRWSFDVGHVKENSPVTGFDHNTAQLDLVRPFLPPFENSTIVDIGPADGYFGLTAAREGAAQVYMIEPDPLFCQRVRFFAKYYGVDERVHVANNFLVGRYAEILRRSDLCIALGLLYHMWPLRGSLDLLLQTRGTLLLEYVTEDRDMVDPDAPDSDWRAGCAVPDRWLQRYLSEQGWDVREFPEWEERVARERPSTSARKMIVCRRRTN